MKKKDTRGGKAAGGEGRRGGATGRKAAGAAGGTGRTGGKRKAALPPWMPEPAPARPAAARDKAAGERRRTPARALKATSAGFRDPYADREAERYANPIASREAILALLHAATGPQTAEDLAGQLGLTEPERFEALLKRLGAMVRDGQLVQNRRGGYAPVEQTDLVPGTVIANPDGFGFLRTDDGTDDLFLPPAEMRKVMHGDRVLVSVTGMDRRGRREGRIARVLERRLTRLIGHFATEAGIHFVVPDDKRIQRNVQVPPAVEYCCVGLSHRPRTSPSASARDRRGYGSTACIRGGRQTLPSRCRYSQPSQMPQIKSPRAVGTIMSVGAPHWSRISVATPL